MLHGGSDTWQRLIKRVRSTKSRRKRLTLIDNENRNYAFQGTSRFRELPIIHAHNKPLILDVEISDFINKIQFISTHHVSG